MVVAENDSSSVQKRRIQAIQMIQMIQRQQTFTIDAANNEVLDVYELVVW
jgi:hypothetical protein